ncbi:hypothetical protein TWF788_010576 [Orbilia oligospora]|uniref:Uncharacterized protein n=1 Tax=Orbilia oligospora TaxID=2813651 RepID=A0A7C8U0H6_ORBOL|nr:hypothetical protein TWF788_010576 [Orbilia oligospora]
MLELALDQLKKLATSCLFAKKMDALVKGVYKMEVAGGVEPTEKQVNPGKNLLKEEGKENNRADGCSACMALEDRLLGSMHSGGGRAVKNDFGLVRRSARLKEEHTQARQASSRAARSVPAWLLLPVTF